MSKMYPCCKCGATATWVYMPWMSSPDSYYCDACVERGCSCTIDYVTGKLRLDELGREQPCCEYNYSADGWPVDDDA